MANIMTVNTSDIPLEERMSQMIGMHFDFLKKNPKLIPFVLTEVTSNPERLHSLVDKLQNYPKSIFAKLETDLNREIEKGTIRPISAIDLLITVGSLNVAPFLIMPVLQKVSDFSEKDVLEILEHRKQEVIETVLSRLRK